MERRIAIGAPWAGPLFDRLKAALKGWSIQSGAQSDLEMARSAPVLIPFGMRVGRELLAGRMSRRWKLAQRKTLQRSRWVGMQCMVENLTSPCLASAWPRHITAAPAQALELKTALRTRWQQIGKQWQGTAPWPKMPLRRMTSSL